MGKKIINIEREKKMESTWIQKKRLFEKIAASLFVLHLSLHCLFFSFSFFSFFVDFGEIKKEKCD